MKQWIVTSLLYLTAGVDLVMGWIIECLCSISTESFQCLVLFCCNNAQRWTQIYINLCKDKCWLGFSSTRVSQKFCIILVIWGTIQQLWMLLLRLCRWGTILDSEIMSSPDSIWGKLREKNPQKTVHSFYVVWLDYFLCLCCSFFHILTEYQTFLSSLWRPEDTQLKLYEKMTNTNEKSCLKMNKTPYLTKWGWQNPWF